MKIEIKSIFGTVLFSYECEDNTIKKTVTQAVKNRASLDGASLDGASLDGASLNGAFLNRASLNGASLDGASLIGASLDGAFLNRAYLNGASLDGARLPIFCKWTNSIIGNKIQIGCKQKSIEEWELFFNSDDVFETPRNTDDFKQIQAVFEAYKAYINFLAK